MIEHLIIVSFLRQMYGLLVVDFFVVLGVTVVVVVVVIEIECGMENKIALLLTNLIPT